MIIIYSRGDPAFGARQAQTPQVRVLFSQSANELAHDSRNPGVNLLPGILSFLNALVIRLIASEKFIAAVSCEYDFDMFARMFRQEIGHENRGTFKGFI